MKGKCGWGSEKGWIYVSTYNNLLKYLLTLTLTVFLTVTGTKFLKENKTGQK